MTRVHNLISDGTLIALRDPETNVRKVPALFLNGSRVLESLKGTLAVLKDSGFSDEEAIVWLYTSDDSLPGRPIDALIDGRKDRDPSPCAGTGLVIWLGNSGSVL